MVVNNHRCCKVSVGLGCKRIAWVKALHMELQDTLDWSRRITAQFSLTMWRELATRILRNCSNDVYGANMLEPHSQKSLHLTINAVWIQTLINHFRIASSANTEEHDLSPMKDIEIWDCSCGASRSNQPVAIWWILRWKLCGEWRRDSFPQ